MSAFFCVPLTETAEIEPLNMSCISASISFVLLRVILDIFGDSYAITVTVFDWLTVYPLESVAVTVTVIFPLFDTLPTVRAAPVVFDTVTPLQVAEYDTTDAPFLAVAADGVITKED